MSYFLGWAQHIPFALASETSVMLHNGQLNVKLVLANNVENEHGQWSNEDDMWQFK